MTAITKSWSSIADSAVDPDSPVTTGLVTGIRDNLIFLREWLGESFFAGAVQDHNHDGVNSAAIPVGPNLLRNGSFEDDLNGWTSTPFTGGTVAVNTSVVHHGAQSAAFTSTVLANGGGQLLMTEFIAVGNGEVLQWEAWLSASVANVSSRLEIIWYNAAQAQISAVSVVNLTNTPTGATRYAGHETAVANARFAKIRVTGGVPAIGAATGTIYADGIKLIGAAGLVFLEEQEASSSATLDFDSCVGLDFQEYELHIINLIPATDGALLRMRVSTDNGATYNAVAGGYYHSATSRTGAGADTNVDHTSASAATLAVLNTVGISNTGSRGGLFGRIHLKPDPGAIDGQFTFFGSHPNTTAGSNTRSFSSGRLTVGVDAFRLFMDSGNIASGKARLYGVRP